MAGSVAAASTGGGWKARLEARVAAPTTLAPSTDVRPIGSAEPDGDRGDGRSGRQRRRRRRGGGAEGNEEFARYQRREEAEEAATLRERQERLAAQCDDDGPWVVRSLPPGCADAPASNAAARGAHGDSESDANAVTDDAASALTRRVPCVRPATLLSCATLVDDAATCGRTLGDVLAAAGHNVSDLGSALPPDGTPLAFLCAARCFRAGAPSVANSSACKRWVARDDDALTSDDDPGFRGHGSDETGRPTPLARVSEVVRELAQQVSDTMAFTVTLQSQTSSCASSSPRVRCSVPTSTGPLCCASVRLRHQSDGSKCRSAQQQLGKGCGWAASPRSRVSHGHSSTGRLHGKRPAAPTCSLRAALRLQFSTH